MANITYINGIGRAMRDKLAAAGIDTIEAFLSHIEGSADGAEALAQAVDVPLQNVQEWHAHAKLWRLSQMNAKYFQLLNAVKIHSAHTLVQYTADELFHFLTVSNEAGERKFEVPSKSLVKKWLSEAASMVPADNIADGQPEDASVPPPPVGEPQAESETPPWEESKPKNPLQIIMDHAKRTGMAGGIPLPIGDLVAVAELQRTMMRELAAACNVPYSMAGATAVIHSLTPIGANFATLASAIKTIPYLGTLAGSVSGAYLHAVNTYAIGNTLLDHFIGGGTFDSFDGAAHRRNLEAHQKMGEEVLKGMVKEKSGLKRWF